MLDDNWYLKSVEEVFSLLQTNEEGLSRSEAKKRLSDVGPNCLEKEKDRSHLRILWTQFCSLFVLILLVVAFIKLFFHGLLDGIVLIVTVLLMVMIGFFQEVKAEKALDALKKLSAHKSKVKRDGKISSVFSENLVPGDVIALEAGDTIPADARVISTVHLRVKEAMLSGESMPVEKSAEKLPHPVAFFDRHNMVYAGTIVVHGKAIAVVTHTGMATQVGQIAKSLQSIHAETTPLQKNIQQIGNWSLVFIVAIVSVLGGIAFLRGMGIWDVVFLAVAAAISAIPEGLPAAVTITLALGVHTMAKRHAIIRKLSVVETLGATTLICSDKTGTLTMNQMEVQSVYTRKKGVQSCLKPLEKSFDLDLVARVGILCNDAQLGKGSEFIGDPTEGALLQVCRKLGFDLAAMKTEFPRKAEIPFSSETCYMATLHDPGFVFVKGAPETILAMSASILDGEQVRPLEEKDSLHIHAAIEEMTDRALRLIAFGYRDIAHPIEELKEEAFQDQLVFAGMMGLWDPPRLEVIDSIRLCQKAGIRVVMMTGDNPHTAAAIAKELGIDAESVVVGQDLELLQEGSFTETLQKTSVFARVEPSHKLKIVKGFQALNHVVAVTGDGVNDAPALEAAHIGIAMGMMGTDVAKEAADMVLSDDRFDSIVAAIQEGRAIFSRLQNIAAFLLTACTGELVGLLINVSVFGAAPLLPLQILWINLVSGSLVAIPLGFELSSSHEMSAPPRGLRSGFISRFMIYRMSFLAILLGLGSVFVFFYGHTHFSLDKARTLVLTYIVGFEWMMALQMRSPYLTVGELGWLTNRPLLGSIGIAILLQLMILYTPWFQHLFSTSALSPKDWGMVLLPCFVIFLIETGRKKFSKKRSFHE